MPLAKITFAGAADAARRELASVAVHRAIVDALGVPEKDRFQILRGRTLELKRELYRQVAENLERALAISASNVFVTLYEVAKENFSFGDGRAQLADIPWPPVPVATQ